jgi:low affinity Fe/Cu permease
MTFFHSALGASDTQAIQAKLDELLRAQEGARDGSAGSTISSRSKSKATGTKHDQRNDCTI